MKKAHEISLAYYNVREVVNVTEQGLPLVVGPDACAKIEQGAAFVQQKSHEDRHIYGVNTGFGALCETRVTADALQALQYNHVVSHACGVGEPVGEQLSRLVMLLKLLTLRWGNSGITVGAVQKLADFWNAGVIPVIPIRGTVGASGDLAPLAHMALPLLGLGRVHYQGEIRDAADVLRLLSWTPIKLEAKEGLALTNGVQYINAHAAAALHLFEALIAAADVIAAISIQAFSGSNTFYQPLYQKTSFHKERVQIADNLCRLLQGSNHFELETCNRSKQDPYSFRCLPQVHASVRQAFLFCKQTVENDFNGVSDNPLFFPDENEILYGGALHGASTAMALDYAAIAATTLTSISERRTYQLLSGRRGLPDFLSPESGLHSGLMIPQYTSAALLNECKVLSHPASVDTIPTCQLQEDHVSMGGTAAIKLQQILQNCETVLAIELLTAVQATEFLPLLQLSNVTVEIVRLFREKVSRLTKDRPLDQDIQSAVMFMRAQRQRWITDLNLI